MSLAFDTNFVSTLVFYCKENDSNTSTLDVFLCTCDANVRSQFTRQVCGRSILGNCENATDLECYFGSNLKVVV